MLLKLFDPMHFLEIEACVKDKNAACYLFTLDKDLTLFAENLIHANYNNLRVKIYTQIRRVFSRVYFYTSVSRVFFSWNLRAIIMVDFHA